MLESVSSFSIWLIHKGSSIVAVQRSENRWFLWFIKTEEEEEEKEEEGRKEDGWRQTDRQTGGAVSM